MNEPNDFPEHEAFEHELQAALKRVSPPEDFAERVLARAYPNSASPVRSFGRPTIVARLRPRLAIAASLLVAVVGLLGEQHHGREMRRREARAKFEMSMTITRQTLAKIDTDTRLQLGAAGIQVAP